jgi:hypothetical protein
MILSIASLTSSTLSFPTFHTSTTALPAEVTARILRYADPATSLLGHPDASYPPLAQVSYAFRRIYLGQRSRFDFGTGPLPLPFGTVSRSSPVCRPRDTRPIIGETLNFPDLQSLARFFSHGPGRPNQSLSHIKFIRVVYQDSWAALRGSSGSRQYAYEAFQALASNLPRMHLQRLQLLLPTYASFSVDSPGIWNLLKVRGLQAFILTAPAGTVRPAIRRALQLRLCWSITRSWRPTGLENPGPGDWRRRVQYDVGDDRHQKEWEWLDQRYRALHDRPTVEARIKKRRRSYARWHGVSRQARVRRRWQAQQQQQTRVRVRYPY